MPMYMDFHKFNHVTVDAVKAAHTADIAVQDQYGVKYHQFWVNEEEGTVFCLVEGPDKETCEKVHQTAHGNLACALTEVAPGFYEQLMGKNHQIDHGLVHHADGTIDLGYRNILVVSVYGNTQVNNLKALSPLLASQWAKTIIIKTFASFKGRELKWDTDDSLIGIFDDASQAVQCALQIQHNLLKNEMEQHQVIFRIGINASQPVTAQGDFFNEAIKLTHNLNLSAQNNQIVISSLVRKLCNDELIASNLSIIKTLQAKEEEFLSNIIHVAEAGLSDEQFNLDKLSSKLGVSRPQLYRKLMSHTGRSPHDFLHDLRMNKALHLLKQNNAGIAEIAYQTGFNSPSYFAKCFTEKFGCSPSEFAKKIFLFLLFSSEQWFLFLTAEQ